MVTVRSSGRFPALPRSAPAGRLAWWDGVSHVVTRPAREHVTQPARSYPDPRARHLTREHVCQSDVLAGQVTISRTAAPDAAAPRASRCAFHPRERRLDHRGPTAHEWSKENAATNPPNNLPGSRNTVVQRNSSGPTAFKWSKRAGRVTTCETPSRHAGRSTGRGGAGRGDRPRQLALPPRRPTRQSHRAQHHPAPSKATRAGHHSQSPHPQRHRMIIRIAPGKRQTHPE